MMRYRILSVSLILVLTLCHHLSHAQTRKPIIQYTVSMPQPASHYFHVLLTLSESKRDTVTLKMPQWMPGYYQIMNYANAVENVTATESIENRIRATKVNDNTWQIIGTKGRTITLNYDVKADKQFVALERGGIAKGAVESKGNDGNSIACSPRRCNRVNAFGLCGCCQCH